MSGLDLSVAPGEIHALVGLNGSGKTTVMRAALGMLRLTSGSVDIDGIPLARMPARSWQRVGYKVEQPFHYAELDVRTNLRLAARLHLISRSRIGEVVQASLDELDLTKYAAVAARHLSSGNKERVGLAAALQHEPKLIILDEPTNALDPAGVILLRKALQRRTAEGSGVLVSSHHLDEVARIAQRISIVNRGRIIGHLEPNGNDLEHAFFEAVLADDRRES
ncbi:MAG: ABC transporter ATP-binding protein [Propionibacteriaceae bacterium]